MNGVELVDAAFIKAIVHCLRDGGTVDALAAIAVNARNSGLSLQRTRELTITIALVFRHHGDEAKDDLLLELSDRLHGFCNAEQKID